MIRNLIYIFVFLYSFGCICQTVSIDSTEFIQEVQYDKSAITPLQFDDQAIQELKQDEAFDYVEFVPPDNIWTRFKNWINEVWNSFINWILQGNEATGILGFLVKALPYLLIAGVLVFLIWLFLRIDLGGSPLKNAELNKVILSDEQDIIETHDIESLITQALHENNYRLAVRFYYLLVLQKLSKKDIIDWQVQKTNADYVYEIKSEGLRNDFTKLTRIYDFIWYGNFDVNETDFLKAEKEFKQITATL
ncbi:hypothetical protein DSM03_103522 [Leeuwenhoekiella aestuarii]|uniref:Protein-glutamine gamma-glutamyltransferase-like C-terminal domain-containing protein n=1 Tax=Leeuwenhoekiella aestuarii TaxID=2249426 RepID=A0A4Q0NYI8_9FLAO|nr:DUF4129 domain-containing protein [Leeuwenhoekiella aestuarii]RXG16335.1 hypothetical protein DSM03_103522 [Leeuwenhoekiella aestuarii]RXG17028.1 hypothetical protein DSM04_102611 [Leeuwenhoekiella aestuarii]